MKLEYMGVPIINIINKRTGSDFPFTPGIYKFSGKSATGVTRMYKLLVEMSSGNSSLLVYTYRDIVKLRNAGEGLYSALMNLNKEVRVIMFDRADQYADELELLIDKLQKRYMVFVASKDIGFLSTYDQTYSEVRLDSHNRATVLINWQWPMSNAVIQTIRDKTKGTAAHFAFSRGITYIIGSNTEKQQVCAMLEDAYKNTGSGYTATSVDGLGSAVETYYVEYLEQLRDIPSGSFIICSERISEIIIRTPELKAAIEGSGGYIVLFVKGEPGFNTQKIIYKDGIYQKEHTTPDKMEWFLV